MSPEELRREYVGKLACFTDPVSEPPVIFLLTLDGAPSRLTESMSFNVSISTRSGKTSVKGRSTGFRSIDDTSELCLMPGIFSISWVKTVDELDVSGLNISPRLIGWLAVLPDSVACFWMSTLLERTLISEESAGVGFASCSGMKLKDSRHGLISGATMVSTSELMAVPVEATGSVTADIVKLVLSDVEEGTEILSNFVDGTDIPGNMDDGADIAGGTEEGKDITGDARTVVDILDIATCFNGTLFKDISEIWLVALPLSDVVPAIIGVSSGVVDGVAEPTDPTFMTTFFKSIRYPVAGFLFESGCAVTVSMGGAGLLACN